MNKKVVLFSIIAIVANGASAQSKMDTIFSSDNNMISLIALVVALLALIVAAVNAYNISHNRKIRDVNLVNQKDDINVTMDAIKVTLSKDIRSLKRDVNKIGRVNKPKDSQDKTKAVVSEDSKDDTDVEKPKSKRPFKKRKPFRKKPTVKNDNTESVDNSNKE